MPLESLLTPDWNAPHVGAVMSTRLGGVSVAPFDSLNLRPGIGDDDAAVRENRSRFRASLGGEPVYLNQVHGTTVVRLSPANATELHDADASMTVDPGIACTVQVADCMPVLFAGPRGVAGAHAGWRGLAGGILEATVEALCAASECAPAELQVWLGPCIGPRRFEVGEDVLRGFGTDAAGADPDRFLPHGATKWMAHLPLLARDRLTAAGVTQITGGDWCTVEDASRFFSYRRDGATGRMVAAIWMNVGPSPD